MRTPYRTMTLPVLVTTPLRILQVGRITMEQSLPNKEVIEHLDVGAADIETAV